MALEEIETEAILHQPSDQPSDGTADDFVNIDLKLAPHANTNTKRSSAPQLDGKTEALEKSKITDLQGVTLARRFWAQGKRAIRRKVGWSIDQSKAH